MQTAKCFYHNNIVLQRDRIPIAKNASERARILIMNFSQRTQFSNGSALWFERILNRNRFLLYNFHDNFFSFFVAVFFFLRGSFPKHQHFCVTYDDTALDVVYTSFLQHDMNFWWNQNVLCAHCTRCMCPNGILFSYLIIKITSFDKHKWR